MKIDRQSRQSAKRLFRACLRLDSSLDETRMRDVITRLVDEKPRGFIAIMNRLRQLIELSVEERSVLIESAAPLPDNGASIFADVDRTYGTSSRQNITINPALLGGLRIRRGSNIWDGSIQGRLDRLEQALS